MSIDVRKVGRGSLAAAAFAVVAGVGWLVTREGDSSSEPVAMPEAGTPDAAVDAFVPDSPIDAPDPTTWTWAPITGDEEATGLNGADGFDYRDIGANRVAITPHEQSGSISVSTRTTTTSGTWSRVDLSTVVSTEDAKFGDIDSDGAMDICAGGQGKRIVCWFGPAPWTTSITIDAATTLDQQWLQLAITTTGGVKIWAGGRKSGALGVFGFFTAASPRTAASWTFTQAGEAEWLMSILPGDWDGDGDLDVVISDRANGASNKGTRLYRNTLGAFTSVTIHNSNNQGDPKFAYVDDANDTIYVGMSSSTKPNLVKKSVATSAAWTAFTTTTAFTYPSNTGQYQAITLCDLTGDGTADYVLTHSAATGSLEGVVAVDGASGSTIHIEQEAGLDEEKWDDVTCLDYEGDGDLDVCSSGQNGGFDEGGNPTNGVGSGCFINPRLN